MIETTWSKCVNGMKPEMWLGLLIGLVLLDFLIARTLAVLNQQNWYACMPGYLASYCTPEQYQQARAYHQAKYALGLSTRILSTAGVIVLLVSGGFGWLNSWLTTYIQQPVVLGAVYFGIIGASRGVFSILVDAYRSFVIEERFGFNQMTLTTFISDKLKGALLSLILALPLVALILWLILAFGPGFWLPATVLVLGLSLVMSSLGTRLVLPLFNTLSPLPESPFKERIRALAEAHDFPVSGVYTINGSLRSNKANAFFTGLGRAKKIVLFDTLLDHYDEDEVLAVLAHEIGHYKRGHIPKGMVLSALSTVLLFFLLSRVAFSEPLSMALGADQAYVHLNLLAFAFLYQPVSLGLNILSSSLSRRFEYEADAFAAQTAGSTPLIRGLQRLATRHLDHLNPHPVFAFVYYDHPPVPVRIQALERLQVEATGDPN
jgi:STE24 endopeptidase